MATLTGVGVILVALVVIVGVTLLADNAAESRRDELEREANPFAIQLEQLQVRLLALSDDSRAFVLTGDPQFRERYRAGRDMLAATLPQVVETGRTAGFEREVLDVVADTRPYIATTDLIVQAIENGDQIEAERLVSERAVTQLDDASLTIDDLQESVRAEIDRLQNRIEDIDRIERYVLLLAAPVGIIAAGALIWLALTNQRLLRLADADRARFVSMMTSLSRHGICQIDSQGRIEYCNPAAAEMLGQEPDDVMGRLLHDIAHHTRADGSPCQRQQCALDKGLMGGSSYKTQESFVRKDRTFLPVDITAEPIVVHGRVAGAVIVFEDVTQRQRQEQFRQQFLSFASHELRTPLMIIGGFSQMLQKKAKAAPDLYDQATREAIEELVDGAARMRRITEIVLDLTRLQSGPAQITDTDSVDLRELLEKETATLHAKYPEVRISTAYPEGTLTIESDEQRVRQVVLNLLDNAAKYAGEPPEVTLSVGRDDSRLTVSVRDNGAGIAPEDRALVFEQFYRGAAAGDKGGLGVGLFITKRIVDGLGGTLTFESGAGEGTEFVLSLPLVPPAVAGGR